MPHLVVEYTDNIPEPRMGELLRALNAVLLARGDTYPVGGIRARAVRLSEYAVADSTHPEDAFVHVTLKIGAGRSEAVKQATGDELFAVLTGHFTEEFARRPLALSQEIQEFSEAGTWKRNNIHARYKEG
ncbi:5-carboxymethyl-2-hydroxymuconate delta isomerase [Deinococcus reticulitermitis]|uniref:5-carboxymethyl-2-hydroxymuconate delta isomerase n=1 Tax=Deinococcus reticulitermitis TaxID=856736 RepID=A0A1H6ZJG2_9DEIO|nr:5-carboxymethyl-2-hydroxymuconate Delta-isomerase [Deinococcus reticulitermitis]SEJ53541.1 5-carboxymethyl-2-hydroxymuconate delta isomerase [Deinococcus reticulitermitis]